MDVRIIVDDEKTVVTFSKFPQYFGETNENNKTSVSVSGIRHQSPTRYHKANWPGNKT
jgi:hypothetical protein